MAKTIPLIRAANVLPLVRFLEANGGDSMRYLEGADLGYWFALAPIDPIPLLNAIQLLRDMSRSHGADVGAAIVSQASIGELAFIGHVALGARTPAEAVRRVAIALPLHCSHELIRVEETRNGLTILHKLSVRIDPEALHAVHVLFCSMVAQICRFTGHQPPLIQRIEAEPHPESGLTALSTHFGDVVTPSGDHSLRIMLDANVAQNPFRVIARDRLANAAGRSIPPLAEDLSLAASVRPVIAAMLHGGEPTIERVARAGDMSVRTLQRRLSEENTTFSGELDRVRRHLAVSLLQSRELELADLSERLGYSSTSTLSRAVRRLVGNSPSETRTGAAG
ncbi:helix-turn-helix transcriptional regulator [Aliiruegeria sabulilitoris]|uniref:helix-turn-helix transcriptional regulator n=1 Tax=Aliiruegeria sabulilitoris TaxID=1510458 RepID=UPI00082C2FBE|nr:helix-turn-helix transcriptional regulator [Aliiruegeria sabulilitoris]NDR58151.1 AraC family transcriptional regulator [Pseudoruegeria sp. M32A2M]